MKRISHKLDFRKLSHEALEEIRITSVSRVINGKEQGTKVAKSYGYGVNNLYRWLSIYRKSGNKGLKSSKSDGPKHKLTAEQIRKLKYWLGKDPRQLKFHFGLWTIEMVKKLIKDKFNTKYGISGIHRFLHELGYSYQKPILQPVERNSKKVQEWLKVEYPKILKETRKEKRTIFFSDESGFQSIHNKVRTWGKVGERPIVKQTGRRFSKGVISAITPQGKIQFMQYDGGMNTRLFIQFLKRVESCNKKKVTLIVDNLPVHKSKGVKEYIANTKGKIKMYFLPGYSPNLNPDELVWSNAKRYVQSKLSRTKTELESNIATFMHSIQKRKGYIEGLFDHKDVKYVNGV